MHLSQLRASFRAFRSCLGSGRATSGSSGHVSCDHLSMTVELEWNPAPDEVRPLFLEYAGSLSFDLGFQDFAGELANLPGEYAAPCGALLLARVSGTSAGCVALRRIAAGTAELKRLYVRPEHRGLGLGRLLAEAIVEHARELEYQRLRLDTAPEMAAAHELYESLGFREIAAYRENPVGGARFLELELTR